MFRFWLAAAAVVLPLSVTAQCPDGSPPPCASSRAAAPQLIAVLQFENLTRDTGEAYLAPGLAEELIRQLATTPGLRVASRFQSRRFGTGAQQSPTVIARALDATFLLTGSIQRIGANIRVGVELTRAPEFTLVWGGRFDRPADDLSAILDEVTVTVARETLGRVQPRQQKPTRTADVPSVALQHFLRGSFLIEARGASIIRAIGEYSRAIDIAPSFGRAWARRAYAHGLLIDGSGTYAGLARDSLLARGLASLAEAKRLAPNESDTWMADAYLRKHRYPRTYDGVVESFARAIVLDPGNAEAHHQYASVLALLERDSASQSEYETAIHLDPERAISLSELGRFHHVRRRLTEAIVWYDSAMRFDPSSAAVLKLRAQLTLGDTAGARRTLQPLQGFRALRALFLVGIGDTAEARRVVSSIDRARGSAPEVIAALAALGMSEEALDAIGRLRRDLGSIRDLRFPEFDGLRTDGRYLRFVSESRGLP